NDADGVHVPSVGDVEHVREPVRAATHLQCEPRFANTRTTGHVDVTTLSHHKVKRRAHRGDLSVTLRRGMPFVLMLGISRPSVESAATSGKTDYSSGNARVLVDPC